MFENPIIDNRIINDDTFAVRLNSFLKNIKVNDMGSEEELEYFQRVVKKLLHYQILTAEGNELIYLNRVLLDRGRLLNEL